MAGRLIVIPTYNEIENIEVLLRRLFKFIPGAEILVVDDNSPDKTSRWISGGATVNWSKARELLSRSANLYVRVILGIGIKDATSGFRIYSSKILKRIDLAGIRSEGYAFQIEMSRAVSKLDGKIIEVPITFREREEGVSKMSKKIVFEAIFFVTAWGVKRFLRIK
ncbi:MAG: glycosyltransferase [Actinobacteria bacterium]|nr:glycosyltransferase [Actinomycetota bacterium]